MRGCQQAEAVGYVGLGLGVLLLVETLRCGALISVRFKDFGVVEVVEICGNSCSVLRLVVRGIAEWITWESYVLSGCRCCDDSLILLPMNLA